MASAAEVLLAASRKSEPAVQPALAHGRSVLSTVRSVPGSKFGTAPARPLAPSRDVGTPGPGANFRLGSPGLSADSRRPNTPSFTLRPRQSHGGPLHSSRDAMQRPGPGAYSCLDDPGRPKAPSVSMGMRLRSSLEERAARGPAPGQYEVSDGFGAQVLSTRKSCARSPFGRSKRDQRRIDSDGAGPADYKVAESIGRQALSTRPSAPTAVLCPRRALFEGGRLGAGPGAYKLQVATGRQALSTAKTAPSATMSGRTKFRSYM